MTGVLPRVTVNDRFHYINYMRHWRIQGEVPPVHAPPKGSQFFHFHIKILQNTAVSGIGVPNHTRPAPPMGNPGSATVMKGGMNCQALRVLCIILC